MQNFACRIVSGARKYDHVTPIRKELNWLPVASQLYYRSATMAFKCITDNDPEYLSSKILKRAEVSGRSTRNSQLLNILFLKLLAAKEPFIIEQLICGILWIVLLNCVIQSLLLKIAWGPNYLKKRNCYTFLYFFKPYFKHSYLLIVNRNFDFEKPPWGKSIKQVCMYVL